MTLIKKVIQVRDGNNTPKAKHSPQVVTNTDKYLITKMNENLNKGTAQQAQPRDSKGRFASNKDTGTQMRIQEPRLLHVDDTKRTIDEGQPTMPTSSTFDVLCDNLKKVHAAKNADYGNSWVKHLMKYGLRPFTMRASEKVNRIDAIIDNGKAYVKDESIIDTLIDIAAYALMTAAELQDDKEGIILNKSK